MARRGRGNGWLRGAGSAVLALVLLGAVAVPLSVPAVPSTLGPGQAQFAAYALDVAPAAFEAPLVRPLIWRYAVRAVHPAAGSSGTCDERPGLGAYRAIVDALGPFGLRVGRAVVECGRTSTRWLVGGGS